MYEAPIASSAALDRAKHAAAMMKNTVVGRPGTTTPIDVRLTFTRPGEGGGDPLTFTDGITLDPAALPAGVEPPFAPIAA